MSFEPFRFCPKCQTRRPQSELFCEGIVGNCHCGWDLSGVDITNSDVPPAIHRPLPLEERSCPNGHFVSPGDFICSECGADVVDEQTTTIGEGNDSHNPSAADSSMDANDTPEIAGWRTVSELTTVGTSRRQYTVQRLTDGLEAVLTIYSPGAQPDSAVNEALRQRLSKEHIAELLEYGQLEGQAYDLTERVHGGNLMDFEVSTSDFRTIHRIVDEISSALAALLEVGLRHRALHPEKVLIRTIDPLDLVITGFESSRLSEADLEIESLLEVSRYTAPEAVMGAVTSASDWWGLGMMLLGLVTGNRCFDGVDDQLFLIHVQGNGAPIPTDLDPRVDLLLRGLLATDRMARWQWKEVREWLDGGSPSAPAKVDNNSGRNEGPALLLGGEPFRDPRRFAIEASRATNWTEACDLLAHGRIGLWAEELELDGQRVAFLRQLGRRVEPAVGFRLGLALQILNPQLPLIYAEEIVNPDWLLRNPSLGFELISSSVPELLSQYGSESDDWLARLARRAKSVRERAEELEIELDDSRWEVLVLSASYPRLAAQWELRRKDFPDANHPGLASLLERANHRDEDLILLLAASLAQLRSRDELLADIRESAARHQLPVPTSELIHQWLDHSRRDLWHAVDQRISGFARCSNERVDVWADQFRLDHRLPLAEAILVLSYPADRWEKPPYQEYVASVLSFFEKRVSSASRRGPLMRMTIGKMTPRVDMLELASDPKAASALLSNLIQRSGQIYGLDPLVFASENGPEGRVRSLLNRTSQYLRDTGINGTYIGFPFLLIPASREQSKPRLAPILLWPVKLAGEVGSRGQFTLAFDLERGGVRVNPGFEGLYGVDGAEKWRAVAEELLSRSSCTLADAMDTFGTFAAPAGRTLERLPKVNSSEHPREEQIHCCAVLFHLQFLGQSLVEDLKQLKQRPLDGTALESMLRIERDPSVSSEIAPRTAKSEGTESNDRDQPILVTHCDPSQEEAITKMGQGGGLVVQGPPGTGKSQTIVNLVADSIAHRRSVLIVCQKLPALEVVRKRLDSEELGSRIAMVTNVTADRSSLISEIRSQIERLHHGASPQDLSPPREIVQVEARIRDLEAEIDAHHEGNKIVDSRCERSYRQILGELIQIHDEMKGKLPDVFALRHLFQEKTYRELLDCEEACGAIAEEWLAAFFEGNPLEVTLPNSQDAATADEFLRVLSEFAEIEESRIQIQSETASVDVHNYPDGLEDWLRKNRSILANCTEKELQDFVTLAAQFRQRGQGDEYVQTLQYLLDLERGRERSSIVSYNLLEWVGRLTATQVDTISDSCLQSANAWWLAKPYKNPLSLIQATLDPHACESFRNQYEQVVAVEKMRWQSVCSANQSIDCRDPERLTKWLADYRESVPQVVTTVGGLLPRLLSLKNLEGLTIRFETILQDRLRLLDRPRTIEVFLSPVMQILEECDHQQVERISAECSAAADLWVNEADRLQRWDGLDVIPVDQAQCALIQAAITQFVNAELTRDARLANFQKPSEVTESIPYQRWADEHKLIVVRSDVSVFQDAVNWQSLFRPEKGQEPRAEEIRKQLRVLRQQIQLLNEDALVPAIEIAVARLDSNRFTEVSTWISQLSVTERKWFSWKRYSAKHQLKVWLKSEQIPWADELPSQIDLALQRERARRQIQNELDQVLRSLSLDMAPAQWIDVEEQVQRINGRLVSAFRVCRAALAFPIAKNKRTPLNGWDKVGLIRAIKCQEEWIEVEKATNASLVALDSLQPLMSTAWIERQSVSIEGGRLTAHHRKYLETLAADVHHLSVWTKLRSRLAGCDLLTPRVLSALSPLRGDLASFAPEDLAMEVKHQICHHWVLAREQALHRDAPVLRGLCGGSVEELLHMCDKLKGVRWLRGVVNTCPESARFLTALTSGRPSVIQDLLQQFQAGVDRATQKRASLDSLLKLRQFMDSSWYEACEKAIQSDDSNDVRMLPILNSLSSLVDYMHFRQISLQLSPESQQVFTILESCRERLESLPQDRRAEEIGHAIRWTFWKRRQTLIEESAPVLRQLVAISVDSYSHALNVLDSTRRLIQITDACPCPRLLFPAINSRSVREVRQVLEHFEAMIRRRQSVHRSLKALEGLRGWMTSEWIDEMRMKIETGESIADQLSRLLEAVPTYSPYQVFRMRIKPLTSFHLQVFASLGPLRSILTEVARSPDGKLCLMVRRLIRREWLLAWKRQLESRHPDVLVNRHALTNKLETLQNLDERALRLNRERLGGDVYLQGIAPFRQWEDITQLRGPRSRSLRQFFHLGRELGLLTLRPVWMMTPDVASQLLPLEKAVFDLVIFDEASQMPVEYAISSLYRAKTVFVSGDDKQMPPSTFFSGRLESDETEWTDEELVDDSASDQERDLQEQAWNRREVKDCPDLLHLGLASLPKTTLQIHYRSEYRELISYSNAAFYRNELGVPVRHPDDTIRKDKPIEYVSVNGIYGDQQNPDEALRVVEFLAELWAPSNATVPSIGVVTFNLRQAVLIEELLEKRAENDEAFCTAYRRELERKDSGEDMSFFVKNVENVQGDERDYIVFSTTFGRTKGGVFRRNFGVLGQIGGERRLNVAVTRARRKVIIIGSMPIEEISDMLRTHRRPKSPRDYLQAYLHYASLVSAGRMDESRALIERISTARLNIDMRSAPTDGFKASVASFIRELGYEPIPTGNDPVLGVDFSILNPQTGQYGVGIECDPPEHRLLRRARSREIWRRSILSRVYPVLQQVSAYAWYHEPDLERERLRHGISQAVSSP